MGGEGILIAFATGQWQSSYELYLLLSVACNFIDNDP